jgi:hypothetical protein
MYAIADGQVLHMSGCATTHFITKPIGYHPPRIETPFLILKLWDSPNSRLKYGAIGKA